MWNWQLSSVTDELAAHLRNGGSVYQAVLIGFSSCGKHELKCIVSHEPSGEDGALERHVSVMARTRGIERVPREDELKQAFMATRLQTDRAARIADSMIVHAFGPIL